MKRVATLFLLLPTLALAARDASGNYTLPTGNPVSTGSTITSSWANGTLSDIKNELTDSLSRSGKGGMLSPFLLSNGTASLPAISFTAEQTSGWYRFGVNDLRLSVGGLDRLLVGPAVVTLKANSAAASTNADFVLDTTATRTAGKLLTVRNFGVDEISLDYAGNLVVNGAINTSSSINLTTAPSIYATASNSTLALVGGRAASDAGSDVSLGSAVTRSAGSLLSVMNGTSAKVTVAPTGDLITTGSVYSASSFVLNGTGGSNLTRSTPGDMGINVQSGSLALQTGGVTRWQVIPGGNLVGSGGGEITNIQDPTISTSAATKNYVDTAAPAAGKVAALARVTISPVTMTGYMTSTISNPSGGVYDISLSINLPANAVILASLTSGPGYVMAYPNGSNVIRVNTHNAAVAATNLPFSLVVYKGP